MASAQFTSAQKFAERVKTGILFNYQSKGLKASGRTQAELRVVPIQGRDSRGRFTTASVGIEGPSYVRFEDLGRKPGKFPPIESIQQWIRDKKITPTGDISERQLAFLIARKIAAHGTNIHLNRSKGLEIQKVVEAELPKFMDEVGDLTAQLMASAIIEGLTSAGPRGTSNISPAGTRQDIS